MNERPMIQPGDFTLEPRDPTLKEDPKVAEYLKDCERKIADAFHVEHLSETTPTTAAQIQALTAGIVRANREKANG